MKQFFDTSILVPAFLGDHIHHDASSKIFSQAAKRHSFCAAHSLAELYSTLTRLPIKPMIAPAQAMLFLQDVRHRLTVIALTESEYSMTIEEAADRGIRGGQIYDTLILRCAMKANADTIYTWNLKHFQRIAPDIASKIQTPS